MEGWAECSLGVAKKVLFDGGFPVLARKGIDNLSDSIRLFDADTLDGLSQRSVDACQPLLQFLVNPVRAYDEDEVHCSREY